MNLDAKTPPNAIWTPNLHQKPSPMIVLSSRTGAVVFAFCDSVQHEDKLPLLYMMMMWQFVASLR